MTDDKPAPQPAPEPAKPPAAEKPPSPETPNTGSDDEKHLSNENGREVNDALFAGEKFLEPDHARSGPTSNIGKASIRDMHVGDRYEIVVGQKVAHTVGEVPEELLRWVRQRYVVVGPYRDLRETLEKRRVLLLRGQPGTGRVTTALHLLDELAPSRVFRWECGKTAKSLTNGSFAKNDAGYLVELPARVSGGLTEAILDQLRSKLGESRSFCVLVAAGDPRHARSFGGYAVDCPAPDSAALLRNHIRHEIVSDDPAGREEKLLRLCRKTWVSTALGPSPTPSESVWMARLLARHARGAIPEEEVREGGRQAVDIQVAEWFGDLAGLGPGTELKEALRLAAFRIALAVLNGTPYSLVAEAADLLSRRFSAGGEDPKDKPHEDLSLFADDPASRLPALRAKIVEGSATFRHELIPMEMLEFEDPRYPKAVLNHVWQHHHRLRNALGPWLQELGKDSRTMVWVRAAQVVGYLGRLDFVDVFTKMIAPDSESGEEFGWKSVRRRSAAIALDQAARDESVEPAVLERLRHWRRHGTLEQRQTAAIAYGYALGRKRIGAALEELRVLGTPSERARPFASGGEEEIVWTAGYSVAKLFAFGMVAEVLDHLRIWLASGRSSLRRLALISVEHLANFYAYELDHLAVSLGDDRPALPPGSERWPLLPALCAQNADLARRVAELLGKALRSRESDFLTRVLLARWVRSAESDATLLDVLAEFMGRLVTREGDAQRLKYLIGRLLGDWADPLRPDVAARLNTEIDASERTRVAA
ncbi:hypothetical protein [Amycolatopsis silviterrae]|uniref:Uncharacterized protein n=1 Tax=Amycolatopsis silviterrae TaxID=1656914 RepID=A0ABW5HLG4_9PSEU